MTGNRKVIDSQRIRWSDDEPATRLSYRMIFDEGGERSRKEEAVSRERDEQLAEIERKWEQRMESERDAAYSRGFDEGRTEGVKAGRNEISARIAMLEMALDRMEAEWNEWRRALEPGLLDLAFDVSESIVGVPVESPDLREQLAERIAELLEALEEGGRAVLQVSEADYEVIRPLVEARKENLPVLVRRDANCLPGEFRLETDRIMAESTFRSRLESFRKQLELPSWSR